MTFEEHIKLIKSNKKRPIKLTRKNILKYIIEMGRLLNEQTTTPIVEWNRKAIEEIKKRKSGLGKWRDGVTHKKWHWPGNWSLCGRISYPVRLSRNWRNVTCKMCRKKGGQNGRRQKQRNRKVSKRTCRA
jgi:hypothetical protein